MCRPKNDSNDIRREEGEGGYKHVVSSYLCKIIMPYAESFNVLGLLREDMRRGQRLFSSAAR
jgi:hypothetical protein